MPKMLSGTRESEGLSPVFRFNWSLGQKTKITGKKNSRSTWLNIQNIILGSFLLDPLHVFITADFGKSQNICNFPLFISVFLLLLLLLFSSIKLSCQ